MVLAGAAIITNRRYSTEFNAAKLVYEGRDRLDWFIYRFRASMVDPSTYRFGPYRRTHGLSYNDFFSQERAYMLQPIMHVWQKEVERLTPESMFRLFREAIDLRPPDPRTGIWL
jgi:hypothetical protein